MSDYRVSGSDLTSVASAIRTKGGTSAALSFPTGFVTAIGNIPTGGGTLITKNITANGTYNASSDNADGYSSVTVAVPSKLVTGTFTGTTEGVGMAVSVSYTGVGYPVAVVIYPSTGANKSGSSMETLVKKQAIIIYCAVKDDISSVPPYTSSTDASKASISAIYKNSTSDASVTGGNRYISATFYRTYSVSNGLDSVVRFSNSTTMNVYIMAANDAGYGFAKDIEYTYQIVYSS